MHYLRPWCIKNWSVKMSSKNSKKYSSRIRRFKNCRWQQENLKPSMIGYGQDIPKYFFFFNFSIYVFRIKSLRCLTYFFFNEVLINFPPRRIHIGRWSYVSSYSKNVFIILSCVWWMSKTYTHSFALSKNIFLFIKGGKSNKQVRILKFRINLKIWIYISFRLKLHFFKPLYNKNFLRIFQIWFKTQISEIVSHFSRLSQGIMLILTRYKK